MVMPLKLAIEAGVGNLKAVGLVSFLGFGADAIEVWAETVGCGAADSGKPPDPKFNYTWCKHSLMDELSKHWLWKPFSDFFRNTHLSVERFSYNTPAANPSWQFLDDADHPDEVKDQHILNNLQHIQDRIERAKAGEELDKLVEERCTDKKYGNTRWGFNDQKTCMGVLFTAIYIEAFFHPMHHESVAPSPAQTGYFKSAEPLDQPGTQEKQLFFQQVDWSSGLYAELLASRTSNVFHEDGSTSRRLSSEAKASASFSRTSARASVPAERRMFKEQEFLYLGLKPKVVAPWKVSPVAHSLPQQG